MAKTNGIRFSFNHLRVGQTGLIHGYRIVSRQIGSFSWRELDKRESIKSPNSVKLTKLHPYTSYSIRIFHYSVLGFRLGTKLANYTTAEAGKFNMLSSVSNSTSLALLLTKCIC